MKYESYEEEIEDQVKTVIGDYGTAPLAGTPIAEELPLSESPETVLAMVIDAMVKSRPISHDLAQKTTDRLLKEGYHDIDTLANSTWEERTKVLQEGGYNRYREQCATNLGGLAELVQDKYGKSETKANGQSIMEAQGDDKAYMLMWVLQMET